MDTDRGSSFDPQVVGKAVTSMVQLICDYPDETTLHVHQSESSVIFEVSVSSADYGKVIGKRGQTALALRTLIRAIAGRFNRRLILEFSLTRAHD